MKKKYFIFSSITFCMLFVLISCRNTQQFNEEKNQKPNFVIIFCDDLGYGDIASFGNPIIRTPNLDIMANEGQKWTQFYVADPVCTPSRAGLLTGRYPIRSGMTSSVRPVFFPDSANGLKSEEITIAEVLKEQGYKSAAVGKWHLGHLPQFLPQSQGFDSYYGIPYSNDMDAERGTFMEYYNNSINSDYIAKIEGFNVPIIENTKDIERPADQTTITKRYTERAVRFINENKSNPFFLYLAHSLPHIPLFASENFLGKSKGGLYADVIEEIDWSVGQVIKSLKDNNLERNTIVMFTSDNGPWLLFKTHGGSSGPLRAGKGTTFEGGQRVPTIFWGPGNVKPGIISEMGSTLDIINTFAEMSGAELPTDRKMDGYDLSKVLTEKEVSPRNEFHYWAFAELHAIRKDKWKLHIKQRKPVMYSSPTIILDKPELYDLNSDISEKYDVSDKKPKIVSTMLKSIDLHLKDVEGSTPDQLVDRIDGYNMRTEELKNDN
ncbi:MAG: sulfatase [Flavobacteriaceae bacterium]|nr:sulfatase [Flavobacteriaceae bacterium]